LQLTTQPAHSSIHRMNAVHRDENVIILKAFHVRNMTTSDKIQFHFLRFAATKKMQIDFNFFQLN
jgi:hypothetical protein